MIHVIAKFDEDLSWIEKHTRVEYIIYSKNKVAFKPQKYQNIFLDNIGRESHTYLTHIIKNYTNLPEYIVFSQGKLDDHINENQLKGMYENISYTGFYRHFYVPEFSIDEWKGPIQKNKEHLKLDMWIKKYIEPFFDIYLAKNGYFVCDGANFKIRRENILSRSLDFYKNLQKQLDNINPEEGHFLERSWYYVFNYHKISYIPDLTIL